MTAFLAARQPPHLFGHGAVANRLSIDRCEHVVGVLVELEAGAGLLEEVLVDLDVGRLAQLGQEVGLVLVTKLFLDEPAQAFLLGGKLLLRSHLAFEDAQDRRAESELYRTHPGLEWGLEHGLGQLLAQVGARARERLAATAGLPGIHGELHLVGEAGAFAEPFKRCLGHFLRHQRDELDLRAVRSGVVHAEKLLVGGLGRAVDLLGHETAGG